MMMDWRRSRLNKQYGMIREDQVESKSRASRKTSPSGEEIQACGVREP
jgi:hypothetical protein